MVKTAVSQSIEDVEEAFAEELKQYRGRWATVPKTNRTEEIAALAATVLAQEGLARFSMRRVAEQADLSLASLQYHFKSLADLLKAMIDYRLDVYVERALGYLQGYSQDVVGAFQTHIDAFIDDAMSEDTARFTAQYQALACIDPYAEEALDEYMRLYRESLAVFIRRINPSLSKQEAIRRGAALAGMIDGLMIVASNGKPSRDDLIGIKDTVAKAALQIAKA